MTDPTLADRLAESDPRCAELLADGVLLLAVITLTITESAVRYDYAKALDSLLDGFGADTFNLPPFEQIHERPATDDTRPLIDRLNDAGVGGPVGDVVSGLTMLTHKIRNQAVRADVAAVLRNFVLTLRGAPAEPVIGAEQAKELEAMFSLPAYEPDDDAA